MNPKEAMTRALYDFNREAKAMVERWAEDGRTLTAYEKRFVEALLAFNDGPMGVAFGALEAFGGMPKDPIL